MGVRETLGRPVEEASRLASGIGRYVGIRLKPDYWGQPQAVANADAAANHQPYAREVEERMILLALVKGNPAAYADAPAEETRLERELVKAIQKNGEYPTDYAPYTKLAQQAIEHVAQTDPEALDLGYVSVPASRRET